MKHLGPFKEFSGSFAAPMVRTAQCQIASVFTRAFLLPQLAWKGLIPTQRCSGFPPAVCILSCLYSLSLPCAVPCPEPHTGLTTLRHTLCYLLWLSATCCDAAVGFLDVLKPECRVELLIFALLCDRSPP